MRPLFVLCLAIIILGPSGICQSSSATVEASAISPKYLKDFRVIEFRRYTTKPGARDRFARTFDEFFPEAFQQLGAIAAGSFLDRSNENAFTWIRGFHDMDSRARINGEFYYGPVWKEHRTAMNGLLADSDNVLLLRPLSEEKQLSILSPVDPIDEPKGAQGVVVAEVFPVSRDKMDDFIRESEIEFSKLRTKGAREMGVLVSLDAPNNFPQLPVRTDAPHLVWLGVFQNDEALDTSRPTIVESFKLLFSKGCLRAQPELLVMNPTRRSRMRWEQGRSAPPPVSPR